MSCAFCLDEIVVTRSRCNALHLCHDSAHGPSCKECMIDYIKYSVNSSFMGSCSAILCPCVHADKKKCALVYDEWKKIDELEATAIRYAELAGSSVFFHCSQCDGTGSILPVASSIQDFEECTQAVAATVEDLSAFLEALSAFEYSSDTADAFYREIYTMHIPQLWSMNDNDCWKLFCKLLKLVKNPERRANLMLRHLNSKPHFWSPCCPSADHCFKCQTRGFHYGKTCEEREEISGLSDMVPCPACGITLTKGDGCDYITCVCTKSFNWSSETRRNDKVREFFEMYPADTGAKCVAILCGEFVAPSPRPPQPTQAIDEDEEFARAIDLFGDNDDDVTTLIQEFDMLPPSVFTTQQENRTATMQMSHAYAWKRRHESFVSTLLLEWWNRQYPYCPLAAAVKLWPDALVPIVPVQNDYEDSDSDEENEMRNCGVGSAALAVRCLAVQRQKELVKWQQECESIKAVGFNAFYPTMHQRLSVVMQHMHTRCPLDSSLPSPGKDLLASMSTSKVASDMLHQHTLMSVKQFLHFYGHCTIRTNGTSGGKQNVIQKWSPSRCFDFSGFSHSSVTALGPFKRVMPNKRSQLPVLFADFQQDMDCPTVVFQVQSVNDGEIDANASSEIPFFAVGVAGQKGKKLCSFDAFRYSVSHGCSFIDPEAIDHVYRVKAESHMRDWGGRSAGRGRGGRSAGRGRGGRSAGRDRGRGRDGRHYGKTPDRPKPKPSKPSRSHKDNMSTVDSAIQLFDIVTLVFNKHTKMLQINVRHLDGSSFVYECQACNSITSDQQNSYHHFALLFPTTLSLSLIPYRSVLGFDGTKVSGATGSLLFPTNNEQHVIMYDSFTRFCEDLHPGSGVSWVTGCAQIDTWSKQWEHYCERHATTRSTKVTPKRSKKATRRHTDEEPSIVAQMVQSHIAPFVNSPNGVITTDKTCFIFPTRKAISTTFPVISWYELLCGLCWHRLHFDDDCGKKKKLSLDEVLAIEQINILKGPHMRELRNETDDFDDIGCASAPYRHPTPAEVGGRNAFQLLRVTSDASEVSDMYED